MRIARSILVVVLVVVNLVDVLGDEPDLATQMQHNRQLTLIGACRSIERSQHLIALFTEVGGSTNTVEVSFATGRSTPNRMTIERIISSTVDWETPKSTGLDRPWHKPLAAVVFSAPTNLLRGDFSGWFLVSIEIKRNR
jgi:hypothetical protein